MDLFRFLLRVTCSKFTRGFKRRKGCGLALASRKRTGSMITITQTISISDDDVQEVFIRSPGPGGQNVNKVATGVQLRFDARKSQFITSAIRRRLRTLAGRLMTKDGVLVITAHRHRSQERNRADAMERLQALLRKAVETPKRRRATKPTRAAKERRLNSKKRRSEIKRGRGTTSFGL